MNCFKSSFILTAFSIGSNSFALPEIKLITSKPEILEVTAAYSPGMPGFESTLPTVVLPAQKTFSQFGGLTADHPFTLENQKKIRSAESQKSLIKNSFNFFVPRPICGSSPAQNTLNCFDLNKNAQFLQSYPIPGSVSSTPIFVDNFWLIGTSKGFLLKVQANSSNKYLPQLGQENTSLWGNHARKYMSIFRPKVVYKDQNTGSTQSNNQNLAQLTLDGTPGLKWIFANSAKFVGTPIVKDNRVFILSDSGYVQAFDWNTGKLIWAVRLAPDQSLKLSSNSLKIYQDQLVVGTDLGMVLFLNPSNGHILWSWRVPEATDQQKEAEQLPSGPDKFTGIIAKPLILDNGIVVSNAESMTQFISTGIKSSVWSYPAGSVAEAKLWNQNVLIGSSNGYVLSLNQTTGSLNWRTKISENLSPIMSLFITTDNLLLAALNNGQIFMLDPQTGERLAETRPIGEVNGEFFSGFDMLSSKKTQACISFSQNGFRCFYAKAK